MYFTTWAEPARVRTSFDLCMQRFYYGGREIKFAFIRITSFDERAEVVKSSA